MAPEETEKQVHCLLGRLVHAFARLDLCVGLQLKWLGPYRGVEVDKLLNPRQPFQNRLDALRPLVLDMYAHSDATAHGLYREWFERVENTKAVRNNYAHGRWGGWTPVREGFEFVALSWDFDPETMTPSVHMTLQELERSVVEIERLFGEYMALEKRFRMLGRPSKAWEVSNPPPMSR
jgi:hypothetical protein